MSKPYNRSYVYDNFGNPVGNCRFPHQPYQKTSYAYDNFRNPVGNRQLRNQPYRSNRDPNSFNEYRGPLLHCICERSGNDDVYSVKSLFSPSREGYQPVQIDAQDDFGRTALHLAVYNKLERITEFLLSRGANPNLANDKGETPLHVICRINSDRLDYMQFYEQEKRIIELLLGRGADPNAADEDGFTPLHVVCQKKCDDYYERRSCMNDNAYRNYLSVIESMLRHGADPTLANVEGWTPLHLICKGYGDDRQLAETLFELCDQRYRPFLLDARDAMGETPLHFALRDSNEQLIQWLLRRGANRNLANAKGETPLHVVCQRPFEAVGWARWIMAIRSDDDDRHPRVRIDARDNSNNAPLHIAASHGYVYLVDFLLDNGANPTLANDKGDTPLHLICWKKCLDNYARSMTIRRRNPLPVNLDTYRNYQSVIESMLRRGADPSLANAEGSTPLHLICKGYGDDRQLAEMLFELCDQRYRPFPVDARDGNGETALHLATNRLGNNKLVDFLLRRGADQNAVNDKGETPLHIICRRGDLQMLRLFFEINQQVERVVQVDAKDTLGRTPLQWAVANFKLDMIDLLLDRGADLSSFVFPIERHFYERFGTDDKARSMIKAELVPGIMMVVEHLQSKGYELELSDAVHIMSLFAEYELPFTESTDLDKRWYDDEELVIKSQKIMVNPSLSLRDLIQLQPKEAAKQLTYVDYFEFMCSTGLEDLITTDLRHFRACVDYLCEKLSSKFFRSWALQPFQKLIHYRLPIEICEIIIETLTNKDLCHICLVAEGQTVDF
ncbi:ankyrin-1-like [Trichogramma pretiosum]|uniref:ankyrin-1-like n=1 Tax=Trichogramma pretiosum TaxID=7493 RepID=UPI0006C95D19|nr:ankyrin-1-like [Trichogramma pretiosum]